MWDLVRWCFPAGIGCLHWSHPTAHAGLEQFPRRVQRMSFGKSDFSPGPRGCAPAGGGSAPPARVPRCSGQWSWVTRAACAGWVRTELGLSSPHPLLRQRATSLSCSSIDSSKLSLLNYSHKANPTPPFLMLSEQHYDLSILSSVS